MLAARGQAPSPGAGERLYFAIAQTLYVRSQSPRLRAGEGPLLDAPADLIEARVHIEPTIAMLCAERIQPAEIDRLSLLVDDAEHAAEGRPTLSIRVGAGG